MGNRGGSIRELYIELNANGVILYISSNSLKVLGYDREIMIGKNLRDFFHQDIEMGFEDLVKSEKMNCLALNNSRREVVYMDVEYSLQQDNNSCTIILSMFDVTKYILRQEKLDRVLQIFEKSDDIIYSFDLKPEPNYAYLSPAIEKCLGYSLDENKKNPLLACDVVHPDYYDVQVSKIRGEIDSNQSFITRYKHKTSGEYIWFEDQCIPIYNESGELLRIDGICRNIHERKQLEEKLWYLSYHDTLTGLYNRTYFEEKIKELDEGRDIQAGIVICDLDNLKYINDKLGHYEGDQIIKAIGKIINESFGERHIACRFGGDEFIIILEGLECDEIKREVGNFKKNISVHNEKSPKYPVQVSIGFSSIKHSQGNIREVVKKADKNMFKEKMKTKDANGSIGKINDLY